MKYIFYLLLIIILGLPAYLYSQFTLENVEKKIEMDHPITHLLVDSLQRQLMLADSSVILFDTREKKEFKTSHIQNAICVDPDMKADKFIKEYGDLLPGKTVIFYCSVGKRSSIFAERVMDQALGAEATGVVNLKGGIFRWYNEGYKVVEKDSLETDEVHPFNKVWGQLVKKREKR